MIISLETRIESTARVRQISGLFDLPEQPISRIRWRAELPLSERDWRIGLITGPSGCGKSTVARHLFPSGEQFVWPDDLPPWPDGRAVVDGFPAGMSIRTITEWLSAVGFSSPPAWLQSYSTLSTGQRFRADLARLLATAALDGRTAVCDEFTSVVDRTVAQVGSAAVAKAIRRDKTRLIAVTCHADVIDWLQPDWCFRPDFAQHIGDVVDSESAFAWRSVQPRPRLQLEIVRSTAAAWPKFAAHHYLAHSLNPASVCFLALHEGQPIAFSAWVNHLSAKGGRREHRTVVLPDWQGVGIGMALSSTIASMWTALGLRALSTTTHPAFIAARCRSRVWKMTRSPSAATGTARDVRMRHAVTRLTAGFIYVGPAMNRRDAQQLFDGPAPSSRSIRGQP